tara:strand:+ start:84 stop:314 length:231 start_codon:yes stop_codon:yes gene_type:complete
MSVPPVDPVSSLIPVHNFVSHATVPLKNATGVEHITTTEVIGSDGRTMSTTEIAHIIYDKFGRLQTIPPQSRGELF